MQIYGKICLFWPQSHCKWSDFKILSLSVQFFVFFHMLGPRFIWNYEENASFSLKKNLLIWALSRTQSGPQSDTSSYQTNVITCYNSDLQFWITTHFQFSKLLTEHQMTICHKFIWKERFSHELFKFLGQSSFGYICLSWAVFLKPFNFTWFKFWLKRFYNIRRFKTTFVQMFN